MRVPVFPLLFFYCCLPLCVFSQTLSFENAQRDMRPFENPVPNGRLRVSDNGRFLVHENGKPFFWLGDTAWELFHRLNREDAEKYLQNRASKGFTLIQAVALAEMDGLHTPNAYGARPLENDDPTRPNEAYFKHVDFIIDQAAELGLYIGLLPTWGDKLFKDRWGTGPEIFNTDNAKTYGRWIGDRYKDRKNVVWILGGDRNPRHDADADVWRAMAAGILEGVGDPLKALLTFHPQPNDLADGGSSKWFHREPWLDFNMFQTGHCRDNNVWERIEVAYNRLPTKPVLDGETIYEDHPVCFNARDLGISSAYDVRKNAYLDVFAGACGHTYGCHDIWQMYAPGREPVNGPHFYWYDALDLPGATQMQHLRRLIESRPMLDRAPDPGAVTHPGCNSERIVATRGKNYLFVYSAQGKSFELQMGRIAGERVTAAWYDPQTGKSLPAGQYANAGLCTFTPPASGYGRDWVLVLDTK